MLRLSAPVALLALLCFSACAHGPSREVTLPQLKAAIAGPVDSAEHNVHNSKLAQYVSEEKLLHGMPREQLAQELGPGDVCSRHPLCAERGFDDNDWYYEIGGEGSHYLRHRPALIVGFSRFGKAERTFVLRAPQ